MNIQNLEKKLSPDAQVVFIKEKSKVFGILGAVFGFLSIFMLSILFVPLGMLFSSIGFLKRDTTNILLAILGFVFSGVGLLTSSLLMSLVSFGLLK